MSAAVDLAILDKNDRRTPRELFAALHLEHRFTLDVAASVANALCPRFFDRESNGLAQSWSGETVWCNPPYTDDDGTTLEEWIVKALRAVQHGCPKVVMLLPANRTEQPFWQRWIEPLRDQGKGVRTRFLPGRPRFGTASNARGKSACPFGVVLVIFEAAPHG